MADDVACLQLWRHIQHSWITIWMRKEEKIETDNTKKVDSYFQKSIIIILKKRNGWGGFWFVQSFWAARLLFSTKTDDIQFNSTVHCTRMFIFNCELETELSNELSILKSGSLSKISLIPFPVRIFFQKHLECPLSHRLTIPKFVFKINKNKIVFVCVVQIFWV